MKLFIFFFSIVLISCNPSIEKKESNIPKTNQSTLKYAEKEDYKVINSCFIHLAISGPPGTKRDFGYENRINDNYPDSLLEDQYVIQFLKGMNDSIGFNLNINDVDYFFKRLKDSSFIELGRRILLDTSTSLKLDLSKINNTGIFRLKATHKELKLEISEGIFIFSRISYNVNKDKACFYFENICSGLCGSGRFVFVQKINGIWEIKEELLNWIS